MHVLHAACSAHPLRHAHAHEAGSTVAHSPWVDGHLDLAYRHLHGRSLALPVADPARCSVSLPALRAGRVRVALATIFTEIGSQAEPLWGYASHDDTEGAHAAGVRQLEVYETLEREGEVAIVRTRADLERALGDTRANAPVALVVLMEGADPIRNPAEAAWWWQRGVRVVGMTWARGSRYAGGNGTGGGLTAMGRDLVAEFDRLGVLHDASHLSDQAFADLCAVSRARIVATHSNARALADPIERHLRDDQYREIARRDGVVGLNLYGKFLAMGRAPTLQDAINHVQHGAALIGRDRMALGSDFDGGFGPDECPAGCQRPEELESLAAGLAACGWTAAEVDGFRCGNWLRVLRAVLP